MDKYQNRYRISSVRLKNWDYGNPGMYFITICCKNRIPYFGRIISHKQEPADANPYNHNHLINTTNACLQPTEIGRVATEEWLKTAQIRADMNIELGPFIVMPNHFHAILIIGSNIYNNHQATGKAPDTANRFAPQQKNLASVIRGYKSAVTSYAHKNNIVFGWQTNYYEHVIRSYQAFINTLIITLQNGIMMFSTVRDAMPAPLTGILPHYFNFYFPLFNVSLITILRLSCVIDYL